MGRTLGSSRLQQSIAAIWPPGPGALRAILASAVYVSHVSRFSIGRSAVFAFFILSGYWMTVTQKELRFGDLAAFWANRMLRIWPLLIVSCIVSLVFFSWVGVSHGGLASTLWLFGLSTRKGDFLGVAWSLDIEVQFYLILPFIILACNNNLLSARLGTLLTLSALGVGILLMQHDIVTVLFYLPPFAVGIGLAYRRWNPTRMQMMAGGLISLALTVAAIALKDEIRLRKFGAAEFDCAYMVITIAMTPFIAKILTRKSGPTDKILGDLSYPFYLVHFPQIQVMRTLFASPLIFKTVSYVSSAALAFVLYAIVDRPLERLRKRMHATSKLARRPR